MSDGQSQKAKGSSKPVITAETLGVGKDYLTAIKEGYKLLTREDIILYDPTVVSIRRYVLLATPPKGHWAYRGEP